MPSSTPTLRREPSLGSTEDDIFDAPPLHEQHLHMLRYLAPYSALLLVIGGKESGKTALLEQLIASASASWRVCRIDATPMLDEDDILATLSSEFGLRVSKTQDREARLRLLGERLREMRLDAHRPILAIDNADQLREAALLLLARILEAGDDSQGLLTIILFCQPQIEPMLATPALAPLRQHMAHAFYLPAASSNQKSSGQPSKTGRKALWLMGIAITLAVAVLLLQNQINTPPDKSPSSPTSTATIAQGKAMPLEIPPLHPTPSTQQREAALAQLADVGVQAKEAGLSVNNALPLPTPEPMPALPGEEAPANIIPSAQPDHPTVAAPTKKETTEPAAVLKSESWLLAQNPAHYTLQLMSMKTEAPLKEFTASHPLTAETIYFRANRLGEARHVLLSGIYPTRAQAEQAAKDVEKLTGITPWIRSIGSIQDDLKNPRQ
ncbi:MAG: AAA family ATPase [Gammaproteobacteria bacterium]|nr:AAA family ATPase [Gammaproteobacteria bacterium]